MTRRHVVVVGGGLAGMTAAIALSELGAAVTLAEARPRLGGATTSFRRDGLVVDNGQHVFLRCCTAYRGLLARLGMTGAVTLQDRFDVTVLSPGGRARLRRSALPGPLHMAAALARYPYLSPVERLRVVRAALALNRLGPTAPADLDVERLGDWLAARWQSERARRVLWDLFTVSSLNIAGDDADIGLAATVVKSALLSCNDAADIGTPAVPLAALHGDAAGAVLARLGATVRLGVRAEAVEMLPSGGFAVRLAARGTGAASTPVAHQVLSSGGPGAQPAGRGTGTARTLVADGVVLAVPPEVAARLVPPGAVPSGAGRWLELGSSPIVNVHVVYDRRVTRLPFAAAVDSPVQWVFDRTKPSGLAAGQYLAVSLSAADDYIGVPAAELRGEFLPAMEGLFPAAQQARVADFFVTRERRATFRQAPGCARLRPAAATAVTGLALAGAWTDTGWPDTMEGAVRSGLNAARALRAVVLAPRGEVPQPEPDGVARGAPSPGADGVSEALA